MASLADMMLARQNPYASAVPQQALPTLSLTDQKKAKLLSKQIEKEAKLNPNKAAEAFERLSGSDYGGGPSLSDFAMSSLYRGAGSVADGAKEISNILLDTNFDASEETGYSNQATADALAGVSLADRQSLADSNQQTVEHVAEGNYWDAFTNALGDAPLNIADSAGSIAELAVGGAATALTGFGGSAVLARRAQKIGEGIDDVVDMYDKAKKANLLTKSGKFLAKSAGQTSLLNLDIVNSNIKDYRENHNGEDPDNQQVATMALTAWATSAMEVGVIQKLFVPNLKKEIIEEGKNLLDISQLTRDSSNLRHIVKRAWDTTKKVLAASGGEAAQEYAQTWQEILTSKIDVSEANDLWASVIAETENSESRAQAGAGAIIGATAGGGTRLAIAAPSLAAGTGVDLARGTAKTAADIVGTRAANKAAKLLDSATTDEVVASYNAAKAERDILSKNNDKLFQNLKKAKTFNDIESREMQDRVLDIVGNKDINDPEVFKSARQAVMRGLKQEVQKATAALEFDRGTKIARQVGKKAVNKVASYVDITPEQVEKTINRTIKRARIASKKVQRELRDFNTSDTAALLEGTLRYGVNSTKENARRVTQLAKEHTPETLRSLASTIDEHLPNAAQALNKDANRIEQALRTANARNDRVVDSEGLSFEVKNAAQADKITNPDEVPSVVRNLIKDSQGKITDLQTIETLERALDTYERTNYTGPGALTEKQAKDLRTKFRRFRKTLKDQPAEHVKDAVKETTKATKEKILPPVDKAISTAIKETPGYIKAATKALDAGVARYVKWLKENPKETAEVYKQRRTEVTDFFQNMAAQATKDMEERGLNTDKDYQAWVDGLIPHMEIITEALNTTDSDAIVSFFAKSAPKLTTDKALALYFKKQLDEKLKGFDPKPAPDTVEVDVKDSELGTNQTLNDPQNPDIMYIDKLVAEEEALGEMEKRFGLKVCSK